MEHIEHPDISFYNRTGFTRDQWHELHNNERENDAEEVEE